MLDVVRKKYVRCAGFFFDTVCLRTVVVHVRRKQNKYLKKNVLISNFTSNWRNRRQKQFTCSSMYGEITLCPAKLFSKDTISRVHLRQRQLQRHIVQIFRGRFSETVLVQTVVHIFRRRVLLMWLCATHDINRSYPLGKPVSKYFDPSIIKTRWFAKGNYGIPE